MPSRFLNNGCFPYVNEKYAQVPLDRAYGTQKKGSLTIQCDELWSFVGNKGNKQWVWLALDTNTREIVGVYIGARDEAAARKLWESLPPVYRQCAIAYTDFWAAYGAVLPSKRHRAVGKETGKTSYRRAIQQYVEATGISPSPKNLVLFKIVGEPHWCYLVLYPSLQCIITYVALPRKCIACLTDCKIWRYSFRSAFKFLEY